MIVNPGDRYGRLTVVSREADGANWHVRWRLACDCGEEVVAYQDNLRQGRTRSCGCLNSEMIGDRRRTHGMTMSAEYAVWGNILARCSNEKREDYIYYGARGIKVCERWLLFDNFYADMGLRPSRQHSIDRIRVDGDYEPGNCRWATKKEQVDNRRAIAVERVQTEILVAELARRNISVPTLAVGDFLGAQMGFGC